MITISNRGFWSFGRQQEPVASFKELPRPKELVAFPPRLLSGSNTPRARAGTRSAEQILRAAPTNELGKRVANRDGIQPARSRYNRGQLGRLTGPGFRIPPPVPWKFTTANKALEGVDEKDATIEDMIKGPLTPAAYIKLLRDLNKTERDIAVKDVLEGYIAELSYLMSTADAYERQGRMPDAAIAKRQDELHDEVDRWVVARYKQAPPARPARPPVQALPPPWPPVAAAAPPVRVPAGAPVLAPGVVNLLAGAQAVNVPRRLTMTNPLAAAPGVPTPTPLRQSLADQIRGSQQTRLRSPTGDRPFQRPKPPPSSADAMRSAMASAAAQMRARIDPSSSSSSSSSSSPSLPTTAEVLAIARSRGGRDKLKELNDRFNLGVSFQGLAGVTNAIRGKQIADALDARRAGQV